RRSITSSASGTSAHLQRVATGFGDLHLACDLAGFGMGDHHVARPIFGKTRRATRGAGLLVGRVEHAMAFPTDPSFRHAHSPAVAVSRSSRSQPCFPNPTCFAVNPIFESRGFRSSMLLVTIRARTASPTPNV